MRTFKLMMQAFFDAADGKKVIVVSDRPEYLCKRFGFIADYDLPKETTVGMNIIRFNHGGEIIFSHHKDYALYSKNCGLGQYNIVWDRQND